MKKKIILFVLLGLFGLAVSGCGESGTYSCNYETRYTGCGGKGWNAWKAECYEFNLDDYKEGWTAEKVCHKFTGTATNCGGGCCIETEHRNNRLSKGTCS